LIDFNAINPAHEHHQRENQRRRSAEKLHAKGPDPGGRIRCESAEHDRRFERPSRGLSPSTAFGFPGILFGADPMDIFPRMGSLWVARPVSSRNPSVNAPSRPVNARIDQPIYCVDDDADDREMISGLLARTGLGCRCVTFASGGDLLEELLRVLKGAKPPLMCFVDVRMSGMSGFDVLRWIRCQSSLDCLPVVMLSGSDDPEKLSEAHCSGAQCYVSKFPPAEQLRDIVVEAQRYSAARSTDSPFQIPCNLLLAPLATSPRSNPSA
jgi:CheY-like chemotaxis protein